MGPGLGRCRAAAARNKWLHWAWIGAGRGGPGCRASNPGLRGARGRRACRRVIASRPSPTWSVGWLAGGPACPPAVASLTRFGPLGTVCTFVCPFRAPPRDGYRAIALSRGPQQCFNSSQSLVLGTRRRLAFPRPGQSIPLAPRVNHPAFLLYAYRARASSARHAIPPACPREPARSNGRI